MGDIKVIVFKDRESREIATFVNDYGHGARMDLSQFMGLVAQIYGSPASTFTKKTFLANLQKAAQQAVRQMKATTREIAATNLEPKPKDE